MATTHEEMPPRVVLAVIVLLSEGDKDGARLLLSGRSKDELVDALLKTADVQLGAMDALPPEILAEVRAFLTGDE
jgi:hypothetical protein